MENHTKETTNIAENKNYAADVLRMKSILKKWQEENEVSESFKALEISQNSSLKHFNNRVWN